MLYTRKMFVVTMGSENTKRLQCLLTVVLVVTSSLIITLEHGSENAVAEADEEHPWASFGGDRRNTRRSPYDTSHVDGTVKWEVNVLGSPQRHMPVIDRNGVLYSHGTRTLEAINAKDGSRIWGCRVTEPGDLINRGGDSRSAAIAEDGTIYLATPEIPETEYSLSAVNPNGTLRWKYVYESNYESPDADASPVVGSDGTIYFNGGRYVHAINPDGTLKWKTDLGGFSESSPAIGDDTIYVSSIDLYSIYKNNGTLKWRIVPVGTSTPTVGDDGTIYVTDISSTNITAINPNGTRKWSYHIGRTTSPLWTSPAVAEDGTIYVTGNDKLTALNPDGTLKWAYPTGPHRNSSPAIGGDGTIYTASGDGYFYAINPDGTLRWKHYLGNYWMFYDSPVICGNGDVYIYTSYGQLVAFGDEIQDDSFPIPGFPVVTMVAGTLGAIVVYGWRKGKRRL